MNEKNSFTVVNDEGKEVKCDVLFTYDNDETNKSYIAYTDNTKDENGQVRVYASIFDPKQENPSLEPITTEKEWQVIETILQTLQEEVAGNKNN